MQTTRIEQLKKLIVEEPNEVFYPYALALELMKTDKKEALKIFENLIDKHPDYLPAYYQTGLLSIELSENGKARKYLETGIQLAFRQVDLKTRSELQSLLHQLDE